MPTIIVVVNAHVARCCIHDVVWAGQQGLLVTLLEKVAFFFQLCNQLKQINKKQTESAVKGYFLENRQQVVFFGGKRKNIVLIVFW